jgi:prolyl-tRNA synthetase
MKDSYSLDVDAAGLDASFQRHFEAYRRIFSRCGLDSTAVEASSGSMGGSESVEFTVASEAGEDWVVSCAACGYAANIEKARAQFAAVADRAGSAAPEPFATPGVRSIEDLAAFEGGAPAEHQIKTLVVVLDGEIALVLLRGDHSLSEPKLADACGASELRHASEQEIRDALGADAGSLGPVGVAGRRILADLALRGRAGLVTGANRTGFHLRGVDVERDIANPTWLDLREARAGDACALCDAPLDVRKSIEVGHIFKLGTRYSEALGALVQDEDGNARPIVMGSYGIGIERTMAAVVESSHDEAGMIWPVAIAPFEVVITVINPKQAAAADAGGALYDALIAEGIDVVLDDRDERPGVKFNDADLIGIPYRVTVGPKGLAEGIVELAERRGRKSRNVPVEKAATTVAEAVLEDRAAGRRS